MCCFVIKPLKHRLSTVVCYEAIAHVFVNLKLTNVRFQNRRMVRMEKHLEERDQREAMMCFPSTFSVSAPNRVSATKQNRRQPRWKSCETEWPFSALSLSQLELMPGCF